MIGTRRTLTWLLALALLALGLAKALSGYRPQYFLPPLVFYATMVAELGLAALLVSRFSRLGVIGSVVFFAGASVFSWVTDEPSSCGCFGGVEGIDRVDHVLIAGTFGVVSSILLVLGQRAQGAR